MKKNAVLLTLVAALAACGHGDKQGCAGPGQCPAGQYCAAEGICWADSYPPAIDSVSIACAAPCTRDGAITVTVAARDESRLAEVRASLDLDPGRSVVLARSGAVYTGQLELGQWPFPAFEKKVTVTVVAKDEAGNTKTQVEPDAATVTRLKWVYDAGAALSPVAVADDGAVYVGAGNQLLKLVGGSKVWSVPVGSYAVVAAPVIGTSAVFTGNQDGKVFAVSPDGAVLNGAGCSAAAAVVGLSVSGDMALASTSLGGITAADPKGACFSGTPLERSDVAPVLTGAGDAYLSSKSILRRLTFGTGIIVEKWFVSPPPPTIGLMMMAPMAVDATDGIWTLSTDGKLNRTTADGTTVTVRNTSWGESGPVILADGSLVVGDGSYRVLRIRADGTDVWTTPPTLDQPSLTALALTGSDAGLIVPTTSGQIYALRPSDGAVLWSGSIGAVPLVSQVPNINALPGTPFSLAYFPASDGKLYAVVLDGKLDASAPWPKAFHDARNTGNAATVIP
jgi:outer membrane protein assembly factor BamB